MEYYLYHHGILGQHWGQRNGPPYPLNGSDHSVSEKKAGWRKSLDKGSDTSYTNGKKNSKEKKHLTDNQKKAIKIGAAVVATALVTYGTYRLVKSGKLDTLAKAGKSKINELLGDKLKDIKVGDLPKDHTQSTETAKSKVEDILKGETIQSKTVNGFKKISQIEHLSDTLNKTNPLLGKSEGANNCSACGITAFLRRQGYDVTAKSTGGQMQNLGGIVEKCFKGAKVLDGSAVKFGRSRNDAAEMLLKRYGDNAEGVVGVQWKGGRGGHVFNWSIKDGVVSFFDAQQRLNDDRVSMRYWTLIDPQGALQLARLDGLEIDMEAIKQFVE
ncbi:MAG: hypothetical protein IJ192_10380 [Clostridia bacterium]|nr:hypothetical protein [Clostridia bacterium]